MGEKKRHEEKSKNQNIRGGMEEGDKTIIIYALSINEFFGKAT